MKSYKSKILVHHADKSRFFKMRRVKIERYIVFCKFPDTQTLHQQLNYSTHLIKMIRIWYKSIYLKSIYWPFSNMWCVYQTRVSHHHWAFHRASIIRLVLARHSHVFANILIHKLQMIYVSDVFISDNTRTTGYTIHDGYILKEDLHKILGGIASYMQFFSTDHHKVTLSSLQREVDQEQLSHDFSDLKKHTLICSDDFEPENMISKKKGDETNQTVSFLFLTTSFRDVDLLSSSLTLSQVCIKIFYRMSAQTGRRVSSVDFHIELNRTVGFWKMNFVFLDAHLSYRRNLMDICLTTQTWMLASCFQQCSSWDKFKYHVVLRSDQNTLDLRYRYLSCEAPKCFALHSCEIMNLSPTWYDR